MARRAILLAALAVLLAAAGPVRAADPISLDPAGDRRPALFSASGSRAPAVVVSTPPLPAEQPPFGRAPPFTVMDDPFADQRLALINRPPPHRDEDKVVWGVVVAVLTLIVRIVAQGVGMANDRKRWFYGGTPRKPFRGPNRWPPGGPGGGFPGGSSGRRPFGGGSSGGGGATGSW